MNAIKILLSLVCTALWLLTGCAKQQQYETLEKICIPDIEKQQAMLAAEEVLRKIHFTIDKADSEQGYIRTRPLAGARFFEFWRKDNVGGFNTTEANLHSIRRTVELEMSPSGRGQLCIRCDVKVERLNLPQRPISGSSRAYELFSKSEASMQSLRLHPEQKAASTWTDLGTDQRLQTRILRGLEKQIITLQKKNKL